MRTALVSACYLNGLDSMGSSRLERNIRYLHYYHALRPILGFDSIILFDNASTGPALHALESTCFRVPFRVVGYPEHLEKTGPTNYAYCWRALYEMRNLITEGYEKFLMIDSDYFILSRKMADFVRETNSGWYAFWCKRHNFPETACQVLCKDAFEKYLEFTSIPWIEHDGKTMENELPFTHIYKEFNTDRFGESSEEQREDMDAYGQARTDIKLEFRS